jgi:hypothetical protein
MCKINDLNFFIMLTYANMNMQYYQSGVQFTSLNHYGTLKVK